jgi:hypothetical protein
VTLLELMTARGLELETAGSLLTLLMFDPASSVDVRLSARTAFYQAAIRYVEAIPPELRVAVLAKPHGQLPTEEQVVTHGLIGIFNAIVQKEPVLVACNPSEDLIVHLRKLIEQWYRPPERID